MLESPASVSDLAQYRVLFRTRLPLPLLERLREAAREQGRSVDAVATEALERALPAGGKH